MPYIFVTVPFISSKDLKQAFSGYLNKSSQPLEESQLVMGLLPTPEGKK